MANRLELQAFLEELLGSRNVYFQPPASVKMNYPAIVYSVNDIDNSHANDSVYIQNYKWEIILIDKNPDSNFVDKLSSIPLCSFQRRYIADNLNHYVFNLFY